MTDDSFLEKLAQTLLDSYYDVLPSTIVVLPNQRAKVFLIDALRRKTSNTIFAPQIVSVETFIQDIAGIRAIDSIEMLFEFYEVYLENTDSAKQQSFELFANWAKTLLQDFNEIDRYLLNPDHVFSYLKDIEDLKHWSLDMEKRTQLIDNYLQFWNLLPLYYDALYNHLLAKGIGYQGLIYREAVANLDHFADSCGPKQFVFAGFNALNAAEEVIVQHLISSGNAKIFWDIDQAFLDDNFHDAGLFIRRFKQSWQHYKRHQFEWIANDFSKDKNIHVIGTPKTIGQAKIVGSILEKAVEVSNGAPLNKVAVVLAEESLLVPLLYALPSGIDALNITMGFSAKNNPAQILISKLFKMHVNAMSRNAVNYVIYYKDLLDILTHPLVEPFANAHELVRLINANNYTFITHIRLLELLPESNLLTELLFKKWDSGALVVLQNLTSLLLTVKSNLSDDSQEEKISKAFVYSIYKVINKLVSYYSQHSDIHDINTLSTVYKQVIDLAEVSFEGEPLNGLQLMGVLESRVLDFDTVIVTSMNEGKFPAGKSQNSFIPYDVKRELGLPTFKEKDAIYTYHFYHLLQRAKNVYLLYNTESDGLDGGEKSRFITQLEVERQEAHHLTHEIYNASIPEVALRQMVISKSEKVMLRLSEMALAGFSPSALTSYIRDPLRFYTQKILRIREVDEVEESIALNTLGTIIHETLRALYQPLIGKFITEENMTDAISKIDGEVLQQFKYIYKEGEIKKGRNLLAFEVAKRNVLNFLKYEKAQLQLGDTVKIIALEENFKRTLTHPLLPFPVTIGGNVDRIEIRNNIVRIIDYKSGKVQANDLVLQQWQKLTSDIKNDKIIQVLAYAFLYEEHLEGRQMEVGIISFKNMKSGFLPFTLKIEKEKTQIITPEILQMYLNELVVLLGEIFNPEIPFTEKA